jgi:flavodoxin
MSYTYVVILMKILVTYYSRTGTTKMVGEYLARELGADVDEIIDLKERLGPANYMRAARDAKGMKATEIQVEKNPADYDLVIIGTPIWWSNLPPAPRTYLASHSLKGKKVVFYITSQSEDRENVFNQLRELVPDSDLIETFGILQKVVKNGGLIDQLTSFIETLNAEIASVPQVPLIR